MNYKQAKTIATETELVDPAYVDAAMERAKQVRDDSCKKIFTAMVAGRERAKERLNNVKLSLYT